MHLQTPPSAEIVRLPVSPANPTPAGEFSAPTDTPLEPPCHYRPSAFYFRRQIRRARSIEEAQALGLAVVSELEQLKAWVRTTCGKIPPRFLTTVEEAREKGWERLG